MNKSRRFVLLGRVGLVFILTLGLTGVAAGQTAPPRSSIGQSPSGQSSSAQPPQQSSQSDLVIANDAQLPDGFPRVAYEVRFQARGGVPTFHWQVMKVSHEGHPLGDLPPGLKLEDDGLLHGQPLRSGEFQFTVGVFDGGKPQQGVQKKFTLRVKSALMIDWKSAAHVNGSRIEGSVVVTNTTPDDMDLTFVVMAVAGDGRATAIGYQHFLLKRGTVAMELPFGENLPHGGYIVHVDAVGEVAEKNVIYRERLQTPAALQVTVGP
jgi:hypothetical protein